MPKQERQGASEMPSIRTRKAAKFTLMSRTNKWPNFLPKMIPSSNKCVTMKHREKSTSVSVLRKSAWMKCQKPVHWSSAVANTATR